MNRRSRVTYSTQQAFSGVQVTGDTAGQKLSCLTPGSSPALSPQFRNSRGCSDFDGNTFRAVYTVRIKGVIYVLHAFQKKSRKGISTPKTEIDKIKRRLKEAESLAERE